MKITFVDNSGIRTDKLGIMSLSAILREQGHTTKLVIDSGTEIDKEIEENRPDFLFYSVMTGDHRWAFARNQELKQKYPDAFKSVMGGPHLTFFPEQGFANIFVDTTVVGPAENMIERILSDRSAYIHGTIPDIQALPMPDREIQYVYPQFGKSPMKRFMACRDCPYACAYCFNHRYHRIMHSDKDKFYQARTPVQMIDEITDVKKNYGLTLAYFNDDDLARDTDWIYEFSNRIKPTGIKFCGSVRADSVLQGNTIQVMAKAGCTFLNIALESSVRSTQKMLRRSMLTNDMIIEACRKCEAEGIKIRLQNMIGLPVDDPLEDALATLEFNQSIGITDSWAAIFQPFPSTDMYKYCQEKGLLENECGTFYETSPLCIPNKEEIARLHKWWHMAVKYKIPIPAIRDGLLKIPILPEQAKIMQDIRWQEGAKELYGI
jgi:anaerobic magnesium-protoporphyrin IX monomethyl ester cyclase